MVQETGWPELLRDAMHSTPDEPHATGHEMDRLTPEASKTLTDIAARNDVSKGAVEALLDALRRGHGTQAQFSHPDLGGMGQWSGDGMVMVGDMFNHALKAKVDAICIELSKMRSQGNVYSEAPPRTDAGQPTSQTAGQPDRHSGAWPAELGAPSSTGTQNSMRYAVFPETRRLAIDSAGHIEVYDTAEHRISGVSQQQSSDQSLSFVSQLGDVRVADLRKVEQR